jgi:hypothetical protein
MIINQFPFPHFIFDNFSPSEQQKNDNSVLKFIEDRVKL